MLTISFRHPRTGANYEGWSQEAALAAGVEQAIVDAAVAAQEQLVRNAEAQAYLDSTDWYVARAGEALVTTGTATPVPEEVLARRAAARAAIVRPSDPTFPTPYQFGYQDPPA